jgi:hypothetical protein
MFYDYSTHLLYLVGLGFASLWLEIDDLLDAIPGENVMVSTNTFFKTEAP